MTTMVRRLLHTALLLALIATGSVIAGVVAPLPAHAATWRCGKACNGISPTTRLSNGVRCYDDRQLFTTIKPGPDSYAAGYTASDPYMVVRGYKSPKCNTIWMTTENTKATGRTRCMVNYMHFADYKWDYGSDACDAYGGGVTTSRMVDNYSSVGGNAAQVTLDVGWANGSFAAAAIGLNAVGSATDGSPCGAPFASHGTTVQKCPLWRSATVYQSPQCGPYCSFKTVAGTLQAGSGNWFVCQTYQRLTPPDGYGAYWSRWWAYTLSDQGKWGYVNEFTFSGGGNNRPDAKLRRCTAADLKFIAARG